MKHVWYEAKQDGAFTEAWRQRCYYCDRWRMIPSRTLSEPDVDLDGRICFRRTLYCESVRGLVDPCNEDYLGEDPLPSLYTDTAPSYSVSHS